MTTQHDQIQSALPDRYVIQSEIGRGGMATVYLAEDRKLERQVAIKVLSSELAGSLGPERFKREIGIVAQFNHPNILGVHDSGEADGLLYYVMPFVEGESLRDRLEREQQLPIEDAVQIACEVAGALGYAHARHVVHRDIKPENILLSSGHALVMDFGIALSISGVGEEGLTQAGIAVGTPTYMSPEQATASGDVDGRSDVYSLGCVLYEMLTGQPPFMGRGVASLVAQHVTTPPQPVTALRSTVPPDVVAVLERALAKSPADRFSPAEELARALRAPEGTISRGVGRKKQTRVVAAVVAFLAAIGALMWQGIRQPAGAEVQWRWMIMSELEGSAPAEVRDMVQSMLRTSLEQSPALRILSEQAVQRGMADAGKPDTARVTDDIALELAERVQIPTVLAGEVNTAGSTYSLSLRVISPDSGTVVSVPKTAVGLDAFLAGTIDEASKELVEGVEKNRAALGPMRPLSRVMTPSMEALQEFRAQTAEDFMRGDFSPMERAIEIDTAYATALLELAGGLFNQGLSDSAEVVLRRAERHSDRLTDDARASLQSLLRSLEGDYPGAYLALRPDGRSDGGPNPSNRAMYAGMLGRYATADSVIQFSKTPFGRSVASVGNELVSLLALGRLEDARDVLDEAAMSFPFLLPMLEQEFYIAQGAWDQAESIAVAETADPTIQFLARVRAIGVEASALAARGEVEAATARLQEGGEFADGSPFTMWFSQWVNLLSLMSDRERPEFTADTATAFGRVEAGLDAALRGDVDRAREHLVAFQSFSDGAIASLGSAPDVVEAAIASTNGDWEFAIETLTPMEAWTWPHYLAADMGPNLGGLVLLMLARAHEATDDLESAVGFYEKLGSPPEIARRYDLYGAGLSYSFAHQRLVVLYAALGRIEDAERHWEAFSTSFTNPDPELVSLIDEAREALEAARAN